MGKQGLIPFLEEVVKQLLGMDYKPNGLVSVKIAIIISNSLG